MPKHDALFLFFRKLFIKIILAEGKNKSKVFGG
jgi:hypothetical protein